MSQDHQGKLALLLTVSGAVLTMAMPATAQAQPAPDSAVDEVVITASRVSRSGFTAPTPVTVIGAEQLEARGATNVTDVINESPAFRPSQTPAAAARGGGVSGGSFLDLRGLNGITGSTSTARTLVLLDGRRHVPANAAAQVDINMIPSGLVERAEVVTGGASAAWGSDAVAGVVNLILKSRLQGLEASASYGQTDKSDYKEFAFHLAGGTSFAGGRGHIIAGIDYVDNDGVRDSFVSRDWAKRGDALLALAATRPAGLPSRVLAPDVRISDRMAPGGVIVGGPLDNIEFTGGQGTRTFTPGALVGGNQMMGGGANNSNAGIYFTGGSNLVNPIKRYAALARVSFDFTESLTGFAEFSHGESEFRGFSASRRDDQSLIIQRDNAFLPESVRAQMVARSLATITVGRVAYDTGYGFYTTSTDSKTNRFVAGLEGDLFKGWKWDAYYQIGENHFVQNNQSTINTNYTAAIDAIVGPTGQIICRPGAALTAADANCVPFNIFGQNSPSQAAINYVRGVGVNDVTIRQQVAALNVNGDLFSLPAGPVSVAAGLEYRKEEASSSVDNNSLLRRYDLNNYQPIKGEYDTKEVYAETVVPLLSDMFLARKLELNAAVRRTDYSTSGPVTTWKVGGSYEPVGDVRLRATLSRDIRAPNINELFSSAIQTRVNVINPNTGVTGQVNLLTVGNPGLDPEKAKTFTAGVVYQPSWLSGLRASVDYFNINIKDVIARFDQQTVVDRCTAGVTVFCSDITYANPATITQVVTRQLNFNSLKTSGMDMEVSYTPRPDFLIPGQLQFRALGSYVADLITTDPAGPIDRAKQTVPEWSWNLQANYSRDRFSGNLQVRYVGPTVVDATLKGPNDPAYSSTSTTSISDNTRPGVTYVSLSAQYDLMDRGSRRLQLFGVLNNVFDTEPPSGGGGNATTAPLYDLIGRAFRVGLRFNY